MFSFALPARQWPPGGRAPPGGRIGRIRVSSSSAKREPIDEGQAKHSLAIPTLLRGIAPAFFEGLRADEIKAVLSAATQRHFPSKVVVTEQGDRADHVFLLTTGRARYFFVTAEGRKHILLWLPPGELFGAVALLPRASNYVVSTETVQPSYVLSWTRSRIRDLAAQYPRLMENALSVAIEYLNIYVATHVAMTSETARQRLARLLASLASGFGHKVPGGIQLDVTNEDLAHAANVTHFTASRLLSEWHRSGALTKERGKILLRSPELLLGDRM
jgi:CRP-like cAMP-binding protein